MNLKLYFNTIRHLKIEQIFFQIFYRICKSAPPNKKNYVKIRDIKNFFVETAKREPCLFDQNTFRFNNISSSIELDTWNSAHQKKLWQYNLHYFNDLNAKNSNNRTAWHKNLIESWTKKYTYNPNRIGWDPYPTSLRIVNLIKWVLLGNNLDSDSIDILFYQGIYLEKRIERNILGNHLFANAKALIFLGLFFESKKSNRWLLKGIKIISRELNEQVLKDGGNFELTPSYHINCLEDILDILNIFRIYDLNYKIEIIPKLELKAISMLNWIDKFVWNDGTLPSFNDTALNLSVSYNEIIEYSKRLLNYTNKNNYKSKLNYYHLEDSGYIIINNKNNKFILDVGRIGPNYLTAHSHADTLSFEFAKNNQKIFINSGTSCYEKSYRREFERSTKAHNTVEIDGANSSNVWSSFRVAERAIPKNLNIIEKNNTIQIECSHNGYNKVFRKKLHNRVWIFKENKIIIRDFVTGKETKAVARLIMHPSIKANKLNGNKYKILLLDGSSQLILIQKGIPSLVPWQTTHEMGTLYDTVCLEVELVNNESHVEVIHE